MASKSYTATPSDVNPTAAQGAFPHWNSNPIGSEYASTYGKDTTIHLQRDIYPTIIKSIPEQYTALRLLMSRPTLNKTSDVFDFTERTIARPSLVVVTGGSNACTLQAGQGSSVAVNDELVLPDNTHVKISTITGDALTVAPQTGVGAVTISANDLLVVGAPLTTDGVNFVSHFDRLNTVTHTNYIGQGQRGRRWSRLEMTKYQNAGTTNYYNEDKLEQMELIYQDMFYTFWNGKKGEYTITAPVSGGGNYSAKTPNGIYPLMVETGSQHATSSPLTIVADFEKLAFNSNYKGVSAPRFIFGTDKMLYELSKSFKNPIRYAPNDKIADLNLTQYEMGTMKFIPVPTALFESRSNLFPAFFENMLFVLDIDTINPVCIQGYQPIELNETKQMESEGGRETFKDFTAKFTLGLQMSNTDGSFYIQGIGF